MSDEEREFKCNKCGGTSDAEASPDGKVHLPVESLPIRNEYWNRIGSVVCGGCWDEWKVMEIKVINEYRLNLLEREHRKMLKKFMHDFLNIDGASDGGAAPSAVAEAWTPEGK